MPLASFLPRLCLATAAAFGLSALALPAQASMFAAAPIDSAAAIQTNFLNHSVLLGNVEDPEWYEQNIPFLDVPDRQIQDVYYYRWQTYKEHLVYTGAQYGYMPSEFLTPVGYGAPYGGIVAAAGHHITEGRWLRDTTYGQDTVNYWLAGPGQFAKPATEDLNRDTTDWAHEYSFWAGSSVWQQYLATGDRDFVVGQLDNLVTQYRGWDSHYNADLGLYWQTPVWDATEYTPASYESADPYHGGQGYRPTINAYQYGDARAIASIAALKGDTALANDYTKRADALQSAMQKYLWDDQGKFFKHRARDNNPSGALLKDREVQGYVPWMFDMPTASDNVAFAQLKDPQGFDAPYGPTTAERRSTWFMHDAANCCRWDGPSWPYATAQTLTAVANVLNDYPATPSISAADYVTMLKRYAATQYKNGKPYVAEAHDPDADKWIYDGNNHSEDYNHSTYTDNVISGLIGLRAQADNSLTVNPLAPTSWDHFTLENTPYHGHNVTVVWDSTGNHYNQGKGLRVWVDGKLTANRDTLGLLKVDVGPATPQTPSSLVNIAANTQRSGQLSQPITSYTSAHDNAWNAIDGIVYRTGIPENSRWTSYTSPNSQDYYGVDLRRTQSVSQVRLYFYDDGGGVRRPATYDLQYWTGTDWKTVPGQNRSALASTSNARTQITFPEISTSRLRVLAPNPGTGKGWGLSEFEVWAPPVFQLSNLNSGKLMGVQNASTSDSAQIQQYEDNGTRDHLWQFVRTAGGWYKIKNVNSGLLLAVENAAKTDSAKLQQYQDNGTPDHLWRLITGSDGGFLLKNKNSGLVAGVDQMSTANSANVVQFANNGTLDHLWSFLPAVPTGLVQQ